MSQKAMSKAELDYAEIMNMILNKNKDLPKFQNKADEDPKATENFEQPVGGSKWKPTRKA